MNKIISKEHFSEKVVKLVVEAPLIAKARKAGHFVIVRVGEKGERIPQPPPGTTSRQKPWNESQRFEAEATLGPLAKPRR